MKLMSFSDAVCRGYSADKRKRRRQHRQNAAQLAKEGGGIAANVAHWNRQQAKLLTYK